VPGQPSGLGWTPEGRLLVVSMTDRRLLRLDPDGLVEVADLSALANYHCNDMVVDGDGGAYVGNFGFNSHDGSEFKAADLIRVDPDGGVSVAAEGLAFPNGSVITPDGDTLVVGETRGDILSAWDRAPDGGLSNRRVWANLGGGFPDGICLDANGAIWVADPRNKETIRVLEGGVVTDRISTGEMGSFACMLGGAERRTLFICTCLQSGPDTAALRSGRIETVEVKVPGAGWP
jgi:sugar lactone lactonase YvrE